MLADMSLGGHFGKPQAYMVRNDVESRMTQIQHGGGYNL